MTLTMRQLFVVFAMAAPVLVFGIGLFWPPINWLFLFLVPIIALGTIDMFQTAHTLRRLYPVIDLSTC
jgi:hypothetical protein